MGQIVVLHLEAHGYGYPITILVINHSFWFSPAQTSYNFFVESCQRHSNMVTDHVQLRCVAFLGKENRVMIIYMCYLNRGPWLLNHASYFGATSLLDQSSLLPRPLQLCPNRVTSGPGVRNWIKDQRLKISVHINLCAISTCPSHTPRSSSDHHVGGRVLLFVLVFVLVHQSL